MKTFAFVVLVVIICVYYYIQHKKEHVIAEIEEPKIKKKIPAVRVRVFQGHWDPKIVRHRKDCLFVFGDNEDQVGRGGQAVIRDEPNAIGIPTKLRPYMNEDAFYSDEDFDDNKSAIDESIAELHKKLSLKNETGKKYSCLMFPHDGLGTGRSQLPKRAPRTYQYLLSRIYDIATKYDPDGAASSAATSWGPWLRFLHENTQYQTSHKKRIGI